MLRKMSVAALLGFVLFVFVGCSKVTRQNYDMLKVGASTKLEVESSLGKTYTARGDDQWEYEEENRDLSVMIQFDQAGKVSRKEWIDAKHNVWDTDPPERSEGRKFHDESNTATIHKD